MKKTERRALLICAVLIFSLLSMSSCVLTSSDSVTKTEVQQMLNNSMMGNVTVEGGGSYDVTINGVPTNNAIAGKALLSAVSIRCKFQVKSGILGFPYGSFITKEAESAGSGVIYKLDKNRGDAYIVTNYHVVYDSQSVTDNGISESITVYLYGQEAEAYAIPATYVGGSMQYDIAMAEKSTGL